MTLAFGLTAFAAWAGDAAKGGLVVQGDTTFRLWGVYVPGRNQVCEDGWPAGQSAAELLARLTKGHAVVCDPRGDGRDNPRIGAAAAQMRVQLFANLFVRRIGCFLEHCNG